MKTKIIIIAMAFLLFATIHLFADEVHYAKVLNNSWITQVTDHVTDAWKSAIKNCKCDKDVYAQLAGGK